jgi:acyl transferase domain-containing protein
MNFEERLIRALEEAGISQSELGGELASIHKQSVIGVIQGIFHERKKLELENP